MGRILLSVLIAVGVFAGTALNDSTTTAAENQPGDVWKEPFTGMEFTWVPPGCFVMGNHKGDADEKPAHEVCVAGFWLGKYEVTQAEWAKAIGGVQSWHITRGERFPVQGTQYVDTQSFIGVLNAKGSSKFRLPTEAEWEYACRSGGKPESFCGGSDVDRVAWHRDNRVDGNLTNQVGMKEPNGLGIFDMSGNVAEWVSDWYAEDYYAGSPRDNPKGPPSGRAHVVRGGGWIDEARLLGSAVRAQGKAKTISTKLLIRGFRLARDAE
jgi:formylglycine-generating enzyme required for sulfatase activity